jgi:hypothetical protein
MYLQGKANVENAVAVRADEKAFGCVAVLFEHAVETVFVAALRTILKLVFDLDLSYLVIH